MFFVKSAIVLLQCLHLLALAHDGSRHGVRTRLRLGFAHDPMHRCLRNSPRIVGARSERCTVPLGELLVGA
jgi:hypothetical protein